MRYILAAVLAVVGVLVFLPESALAQPGGEHRDAGIGLYLEEYRRAKKCNQITLIDCEDPGAKTSGEFYQPYYAYLCVFNADATVGIAGLQLNLDYDKPSGVGVDITSWTACSDLEFPAGGWPASGSGNRITWSPLSNCQQEEPGGSGEGVTVLAGFFYVIAYSDDNLSVKPHVGGEGAFLRVSSCEAAETTLLPEQGGTLAFSEDGSLPGKMPCYTRQYIEQTFGGVKSVHGTNR